MCLTKVNHGIKESRGIGYQIFRVRKDGKLAPLYNDKKSRATLGELEHDTCEEMIQSTMSGQYRTGFHIFTSWEDATKWLKHLVSGQANPKNNITSTEITVRSVYYSGVTAEGLFQFGGKDYPNVVARTRLVIPNGADFAAAGHVVVSVDKSGNVTVDGATDTLTVDVNVEQGDTLFLVDDCDCQEYDNEADLLAAYEDDGSQIIIRGRQVGTKTGLTLEA